MHDWLCTRCVGDQSCMSMVSVYAACPEPRAIAETPEIFTLLCYYAPFKIMNYAQMEPII